MSDRPSDSTECDERETPAYEPPRLDVEGRLSRVVRGSNNLSIDGDIGSG